MSVSRVMKNRTVVFLVVMTVMFLALFGCKEKKQGSGRRAKRLCKDFALDVAAAFQKSISLKSGKGSEYTAQMRKATSELRQRLESACRSGELSKEVVSCVRKAQPKTFKVLSECLPEDYRPDTETYEPAPLDDDL